MSVSSQQVYYRPGGTLMAAVLDCSVDPLPPHPVHGCLMYIRVPWHMRHVDLMTKGPVDTLVVQGHMVIITLHCYY